MPPTREQVAAAPPAEQKQIFGRYLYPKVRQADEAHALRIINTLLGLDNETLYRMCYCDDLLTNNIEEAMGIIQAGRGGGGEVVSGNAHREAAPQPPPPKAAMRGPAPPYHGGLQQPAHHMPAKASASTPAPPWHRCRQRH